MKSVVLVCLSVLFPPSLFAGQICEKVEAGIAYNRDADAQNSPLFFAFGGALADAMAEVEAPYSSGTTSDFDCVRSSFCSFEVFRDGSVKRASYFKRAGYLDRAEGEVCRDKKTKAIVSVRVRMDEDGISVMHPEMSIERFLGIEGGCKNSPARKGVVKCFATTHCRTKDGPEDVCEIVFDGKGKAI